MVLVFKYIDQFFLIEKKPRGKLEIDYLNFGGAIFGGPGIGEKIMLF